MISILLLVLAQTPVNVTNNKANATAIAVRCVNSGGTAFEGCGGAGSSSWFPDGGAIGSVTITGSVAVTGPLTDAQLRAAAVPVSLATLPALVASAANIGDVDVLTLPALPTGTNNIGDVDVLTIPALVAGSAIIGNVRIDQTTPGTTNATSLSQLGATTVDANSGLKSAGTLRVVIATDQPALTNKLLVTPDSVALPANQSVNVSQINAVTPLMGVGASGTGALRTASLIHDGTTVAGVIAGTTALKTDLSSVAGTAALTGTGATGAGSARVTLATNSPGFSTQGGTIPVDSALGSTRATAYGASPTAVAAGTNGARVGDLEGISYVNTGHPRAVFCQMAAGAGTTLAELTGCAAVASNSYYVKSIVMTGGIATAATVPALIRSGTAANCGTATATWATCWHGTAGGCTFNFDPPIKITVAHALCHIDATVGTKSVMLSGYLAP